MTAGQRYLARAIEILATMAASQAEPIAAAAIAVADAIAAGHRVFVAGTSHVLHTELYLRAGESPDLATPLLQLSSDVLRGDGDFRPEHGDVVLVGTNAGTDAGTVQVALAAREAGCVVVGLTCIAYERWPEVVVEHPGGKLVDIADIVIDVGGVIGDGVIELEGLDTAVGPTSGVALAAAAWAILVEAAEQLVDRGLTPIVYRSVQIPGAEALFRERKTLYEGTRRGYTKASDPASGEA
jgi:uncharacterized phosphosugar-binding protein